MSLRTLDDVNSFMNDPDSEFDLGDGGRTPAMKLMTQIGGTITLTPLLVSQLVESVGQNLFHHKLEK
jgi:hypothetical protein